jgi:hypothetical protein
MLDRFDDRYGPLEFFAAYQIANEVHPSPLDWLWPLRIPIAGLTLIIGDPGVGKSLLAADLAARISVASVSSISVKCAPMPIQ